MRQHVLKTHSAAGAVYTLERDVDLDQQNFVSLKLTSSFLPPHSQDLQKAASVFHPVPVIAGFARTGRVPGQGHLEGAGEALQARPSLEGGRHTDLQEQPQGLTCDSPKPGGPNHTSFRGAF